MPRPLVLFVACLIAALAGGIGGSLVWVGSAILQGLSGTENVAEVAYALAISSLLLGAFCFGGSVLFGLPAHALLTRLRWTGVLAYMLVGTIPGLLLMVSMARPGSGTTTYGLQMFGLLYEIMGGAAALGFWWIARPDRHAAAPSALAQA